MSNFVDKAKRVDPPMLSQIVIGLRAEYRIYFLLNVTTKQKCVHRVNIGTDRYYCTRISNETAHTHVSFSTS